MKSVLAFLKSDRVDYLVALLLASGGLAHLLREYNGWENWQAFVLAAVFVVALHATGVGKRPVAVQGFALLWSAIPLLLIGVWFYFVTVFGTFDISAILFHLQMGMDAPGVVEEYLGDAVPTLLGFLAVLAGFAILAKRDPRARRLDRLAVVPLLVLNPAVLQLVSVAQGGVRADDRLAQHYVDPATAAAPPQGQNYIHIFLESAERTYFDESFGDVMAPLAPFEARGLTATNMQQTALTGWSVAGMTAANCGVPLFRLGVFTWNYFEYTPNFLPSATCLGDVLARDGYSLAFIMGAKMSFGGIGHLFGTHGYDTLIGIDELRERYGGSESSWGPDDEVVFTSAFDEAKRLAAEGRPYALSIDTAGGHAPNGYISPSCRKNPEIAALKPRILAAVKCTNWLAAAFLKRMQDEKLLENTVVVVQSDHLSMKSPVTERLDALDRRNLFFAFGPGIAPQVVEKPSTPVDVLPTLLALLGYEFADETAGIGVSLLSAKPSLVEALGGDAFDDAVEKDTVLGQRLWAPKSADAALTDGSRTAITGPVS